MAPKMIRGGDKQATEKSDINPYVWCEYRKRLTASSIAEDT